MKTIQYGNEYMTLHDDGCISRPAIGMGPSGSWKVVGAVRLNNFGYPVEYFTLKEVFDGNIQWKHKNGAQRVHILDIDNGTPRTWMNPTHEVSK